MGLRKHAIEHYKNASDFLKLVLTDFPNTKLDEQIGEAETARMMIKHAVATPHWWMKQTGRAMPFRASFETIEDIFSLLNKQSEEFTKLLQDETEVHWTPSTSIPWLMIRSANHIMHHAAMLINMRHIWGLPSLGSDNPWSEIVDYPAKLLYRN